MNRGLFLGAIAAVTLSSAVLADGLPAPHISRIALHHYTDPQHFRYDVVEKKYAVISDAEAKNLSAYGFVLIHLLGENLSPDREQHPGGFDGGYVHVYVRGIDAHNHASNWKRCADDDCTVHGDVSQSEIFVGIRPGFYLNEVGAHLQFRTWISWTPDPGDDPSASRTRHSTWSNIFTIDRMHAAPDDKRAEAPPADKDAPSIDKVSPNPLQFGAGHPTDWTISVIGSALCSPRLKVILNDDAAHPVPLSAACTAAQLPHQRSADMQQIIKFVLPPSLRKDGSVRFILRNAAGDSGLGLIVVKEIKFTRLH